MPKILLYVGGSLIIVLIIFGANYFLNVDHEIVIAPEPVISNLLPEVTPEVLAPKPTPIENKKIEVPKEVPKVLQPVIREESITVIVPATSSPEVIPKSKPTKIYQISIEENKFVPENITIKIGETVTWTNNDDELHWPASDPHPTHTGVIDFDVGSDLAQDESYSYTFRRVGDFLYHDHTAAVVDDVATLVGVIKVVSE